MPEISIIVPFHNGAAYIERCIRALLNQTYTAEQVEYLFVDNNSSDGSAEIVRRYPSIRLLSEKKQGAYAARNRALTEARGRIMVFTDADCSPAANWLATITQTLRDPRIGIVIGQNHFAGHSVSLELLEAYEASKCEWVFSTRNAALYFAYTNNMAVRRSLFDELGPFAEIGRGADTLFMNRAIDRYSTDIVRYQPEMNVVHLEIQTTQDYYQKLWIYGASNQRSSQVSSYRPLGMAERGLVIYKTIRDHRLSPLQAGWLMTLLAGGAVPYLTHEALARLNGQRSFFSRILEQKGRAVNRRQ